MSLPRTFESPFPRAITGSSGPSPLIAWISFPESSSGEPRERLLVWSPDLDEPVEVLTASALRRPAICPLDGGWLLACLGEDLTPLSPRFLSAPGGSAAALTPLSALVITPATVKETPTLTLTLSNPRDFRPTSTSTSFDGQPVDGFMIKAPLSPLSLGARGGLRPRLLGEVTACSCGDHVLICWVQWSESGARLRLARVTSDLEVRSVDEVAPAAGAQLEPRLCWDGERAWLAWLQSRSRSGPWQVVLSEAERPGAAVALTEPGPFRAGGLTLVAAGPGRLWAAWHTDRRPGRGPDLTRWVETRHIIGGRVSQPKGPPPWARWGRLGEDQGLELPALAALPDGRVTLLARSSHRWWRFDLTPEGWGPPVALDPEGWGCRSRRVALIPRADGALLWARRQGQGVAVEELPPAAARGLAPPRRPPRAGHELPARTRRVPARPRLGGFQLCFGDIHQHTAHSDGTGTAREAYERARDLYGDDLAAVTDHESFLGKRIGPGEWRGLMAACDLFDEPGRFVTLPGFEWTGRRHPGPGHRCVYLPRTDLPLLGREHPAALTSAELIRSVKGLGGLVFPHHVGWTGADAEVHDPAVQTCWEVVSVHGAYEALGEGPIGQRDVPLEGHFLRDQLDAGLRFGFVGGSDGHGLLWHHGIAHRRDSHRTGLTAVLVEELTRPAVLEALRARRCYATSGLPMVLDLRVAGRPMGSELEAREPVEVVALADGFSELARADLVTTGGVKVPLETDGSRVRAAVTVDPPPGGGVRYLYLRVEQRDGDLAWSSPVWLWNR